MYKRQVLTYDAGGSSESAFIEEKDRILDGDVKELLTRIEEGQYNNKVSNREYLSKERMADEYFKLYRSLMKESK